MKKELLKKWILFARSDLDAARRLFESPRPTSWTYLLILWHCQQAIEKTLKMLTLKNGKELLKIHDLPRLVELTEIDFSENNFDFIKKLNKYYFRSRYPDLIYEPLPRVNRKFVKDYLEKTKKLFLWLKKQ